MKLGISVINFHTSIQRENFQLFLNVKWQKNSETIYANKEYEILYCLLMKFMSYLFTYVDVYFLTFPKWTYVNYLKIPKICRSHLQEVGFSVGMGYISHSQLKANLGIGKGLIFVSLLTFSSAFIFTRHDTIRPDLYITTWSGK